MASPAASAASASPAPASILVTVVNTGTEYQATIGGVKYTVGGVSVTAGGETALEALLKAAVEKPRIAKALTSDVRAYSIITKAGGKAEISNDDGSFTKNFNIDPKIVKAVERLRAKALPSTTGAGKSSGTASPGAFEVSLEPVRGAAAASVAAAEADSKDEGPPPPQGITRTPATGRPLGRLGATAVKRPRRRKGKAPGDGSEIKSAASADGPSGASAASGASAGAGAAGSATPSSPPSAGSVYGSAREDSRASAHKYPRVSASDTSGSDSSDE